MMIWLFCSHCLSALNASKETISELEEIAAEGGAAETERPLASNPRIAANRMQTELTFVGNKDVPPSEQVKIEDALDGC